ncbi:MAG TPA: hypothetical protein VLJ62_08525 [Burkholderiaceae bacterium]|nr:hypothetical protein [Burkholderiaceae bacterium]
MPAPQRLGKYQILRKLGAGAMGIVYEGFNPLIERSVALKVIRAAMKRLRWISALAMGESRNGVIAYSYTFNWSKEIWAHERALADCARATVSPCVVVFVNGDVRNGELASLAGTLSTRPQAAVRRAFVESTKQTLARGTGL